MTVPSSPEQGASLSVSTESTHEALLHQTDWASLEQAFPDQVVVADALEKLLDGDLAVRAGALSDLQEAAHHQNTIYGVTTSVASYVAAVLPDPRTKTVGHYRWDRPAEPLRAALLDWLGEMAEDASDAAVAGARSVGFDMSPEQAEFRAARPALFAAVSQYVDDGDVHVRHAALVAALRLRDSVEEREGHPTEWGEDTEDPWRAE